MRSLPMEGELRDRVLKALGQTSLFRTLSPEQLEHVLGAASLVELDPGDALTRQGEPSDSFFLLLMGGARVLVDRAPEGQVEIGRMKPPESLGEVGLLLGQPRTATVVAADRSIAVRFELQAFQLLFDKVPRFGLAVSRGLAYRLQQLSHRLPIPQYEAGTAPGSDAVSLLPTGFLTRHRVLPLRLDGNVLTLGFVDDPNPQVMDGAHQLLPGLEIAPVRIAPELFNQALQEHGGVASLGGPRAAEGALGAPAGPRSEALDTMLARMAAEGASDLHLAAGHKPRWRVDGQIREIADAGTLGPDDVARLFEPLLEERHRAELAASHDTDFGYTCPGVARARINLFRDSRGTSAAVRLISGKIMTLEQLGLPESIARLAEQPKGLVLVTGPAGSGKSSTLAAMVDHVNRGRAAHILTLEDPIEFVHESRQSLVQQREVGAHTVGFARALRAALREDPDVLLVGEMRDLDTVALALEAANTGMLVLATLHTNSAVATVDRIVDMFPGDQQDQARSSLAECLRGVVAQTLLRRSGGGRVAAVEVLVGTPAVANLIHESKTNQIPNVMQTGKPDGMYVLNEELQRLVSRRVVDADEALRKAADRKDLARRLGRPA